MLDSTDLGRTLIVSDGTDRSEATTVHQPTAGSAGIGCRPGCRGEPRPRHRHPRLRELTSIFDYFVLVTGTSRRQLHAMSEEIDRVLEDELGDQRLGIEGYEESRWILLDYGDVVIHLFEPETRGVLRPRGTLGHRPSGCRFGRGLSRESTADAGSRRNHDASLP